MQTDKPINMGKALFFSLMMSVVMAATNIAAYQHIYYNKTEIIDEWRGLQFAAIDKNINADTSIALAEKPKQKAMMKENFNVKISPTSFGSFELMMCVSTSMVVALMVFVWNMKKS